VFDGLGVLVMVAGLGVLVGGPGVRVREGVSVGPGGLVGLGVLVGSGVGSWKIVMRPSPPNHVP
jgi:hypothetical protein